MTLMKLMDADLNFHHRSTQINTDQCWVTMIEIPSEDEKNSGMQYSLAKPQSIFCR